MQTCFYRCRNVGSHEVFVLDTAAATKVNVNSASYPQRDGKRVVAYGLRGEGLVWLTGAVVCLCKPHVHLFADAGNGWPHSALQYH